MGDYALTRTVSGEIVTRFGQMLRNLEDDYEEEIVVMSLMKYYNTCEDDEDLQWAIERVLAEFMSTSDFNDWMLKKGL